MSPPPIGRWMRPHPVWNAAVKPLPARIILPSPLLGGVLLFVLALAGQQTARGQSAGPAAVLRVDLRGHEQRLRHFPPSAKDGRAVPAEVLLASGDGGFGDFEEELARRLSVQGYDVYGLDVRRYLSDFTGQPPLKPAQIMTDFASLAQAIRRDDNDRPLLIGWSAGAALVVTAAASPDLKPGVLGVIAISLPREGALSWRWWDLLQFLPGVRPSGPLYSTIPFILRIAPLKLAIIQSTGDRWVSQDDIDEIFAAAGDHQQTYLLEAGGHRFSANRKEFFRKLGLALQFVQDPAQVVAPGAPR